MAEPRGYVIWGCGGHARVLCDLLALQGHRVLTFIDQASRPSVRPPVPVQVGEAGFLAWLATQPDPTALCGLTAIGHCIPERLQALALMARHGLQTPPLVHPQASIAPSSQLGAGVQVLAQAIVSADARIGDGTIVNHKASVDHECTVGPGSHVAPGATLCGCVQVGQQVFVGAGATVLPRLRIGDSATIGAGAVVTRDVPAGAVVVGNPARPHPLS